MALYLGNNQVSLHSSSESNVDINTHIADTTIHVTPEERTKWNKNTADISQLSEEIANQQAELKQYIDEQLGVIENGTY